MPEPKSIYKADVPVADGRLFNHKFRRQHLTTANFMQLGVATALELIPNQHGKNVHKTFLRCDPLDKPCLGSASIKERAFYVPFRTCWPAFTDCLENTRHVSESGSYLLTNVPQLTMEVIQQFFCDDGECASLVYAPAVDEEPEFGDSSAPYDICDAGGSHYKLTNYGRNCLKIFESLGYQYYPTDSDDSYSALPFIALAKVYLDWIYPNSYSHIGLFATIDGIFQREFQYNLSLDDVHDIFELLSLMPYNSDFLTQAWDNPVAPSDDTGATNFVINDITLLNSTTSPDAVSQASNQTPKVDGKSVFTQYLDSSLKALSQYIKRHQLAGSRALERYLLEHGIMLSSDKLKRCYYLGENTIPFEISDIMSMADTSENGGASLGAYAGKGIGYGSKDFDYFAEEYGMYFVLSTIVPDVDYTQGVCRYVMHNTPLDFYQGAFDALGPSAISRAEVAVSKTDPYFNSGILDAVFGFAPRYYENCIGYSRMTGDFVCNSINQSLFGWSTMRLFDLSGGDNSILVHSLDFMLSGDALQFDRIFLGYPVDSDDDTQVDPFKVVHRDWFDDYSPKRPLYDSYEFDDVQNHEKVSIEPNGVKIN